MQELLHGHTASGFFYENFTFRPGFCLLTKPLIIIRVAMIYEGHIAGLQQMSEYNRMAGKYNLIDKPVSVKPSTLDRFFIKAL